jgi:hypothetical protein
LLFVTKGGTSSFASVGEAINESNENKTKQKTRMSLEFLRHKTHHTQATHTHTHTHTHTKTEREMEREKGTGG